MYLFTTLYDIFVNPKEFFQKKHTEGKKYGFGGLFFYAFILSVVSLLIRYGYIVLFHRADKIAGHPTVISTLSITHLTFNQLIVFTVLIIQILAFIGLFVAPLFIHLGMKIMKGKGTLYDTYTVYIVGSAPYLLLGGLPIIGYIAVVYGLYIKAVGLMEFHELRFDYTLVGYILGRIIEFISILIIGVICFMALFFFFFTVHREYFNDQPVQSQNSTTTVATPRVNTI